jgi:type II secretory ATPase GspE/PulE/Tfp pilus assembly ATPase PilB-like protein
MEETVSAPVAVQELIARAEAVRASDVHLQMSEEGAAVSFRLDGLITPVEKYPKDLAERIFGRLKFLARLKTYQESLPQDGRINKEELGAKADVRVATYPTVTGEKIVLRLFTEESVKTFSELGISPGTTAALEGALRRSSGLILLTGPAGSGKTTTIYACLKYLVQLGGRHIITVEDPVERILPGVMQTEVNEARGLTFPVAARHLLRQDPQTLVIGEIRDEETARIAVRAASTGHLVITTLHAGSCAAVFDRLLLLCADLFGVLSSLEMIVNQRLARRLCPECGGNGCRACMNTGYIGRVPLVEYAQISEEQRLKLKSDGASALIPTVSFETEAARLLQAGVTRQAEINRVLGKDQFC